MKSTLSFLLLSAVVVSGIAGCGGPPDDQPELVSVSGTVTLDGKPLANALVEFQPDGPGRPSTGTTDESGEYTLQYTDEYEGVPPGGYTVSVSLIASEEDYEEGADVNEEDEESADSGLPAMASDGSIKKTVEAGGGTIDIALTN